MVTKGPVSVNWQSVFMFIPIVDLWAAYRIQKLRMYLLIFLVGFGVIEISLGISLAGSIDEFLKLDPDYVVSDSIVTDILIAITLVQFGVAVILIRIWSKQWNLKFQSENS